MLIVGSIEDALAGKRRRYFDTPGGKFNGYTDFMFESAPGEPLGPQAFLVHQAPGWVLPVHFHMQHQVQVVVGGSGSIGRHPIEPGTVHYATPHSAYGPITAGPQGLEYFTVRSLTDRGAWYMPESRPMMQTGRKDQVTGHMHFSEPAGRSSCTLIARRPDGLGAWALRGEAGAELSCDEPIGAAGRFHIVLSGSFRVDGLALARHNVAYRGPLDPAPHFEVLEEGSELVVVQLPDLAMVNLVPAEILANPPQLPSSSHPPAG